MPFTHIRLQNCNVSELKKLLAQYGHDRSQDGMNFSPLMNVIACKHGFLAFKL